MDGEVMDIFKSDRQVSIIDKSLVKEKHNIDEMLDSIDI